MKNLLLFLVLCLSWGSTWVAIKVGVEVVPPLYFAGTRFLVAGVLILFVYGLITGWKSLLIPRKDIASLFLMSSMVIAVCFALIFWGEQFVSASITAIVVQGMIPIFLPLFAYFLLGESLSRNRKLSILLGVLGISVIFSPGLIEWVSGEGKTSVDHLSLLGLISIVVGTLTYCFGSVYGRPLLSRSPAITIAGWQNLLGGIITLVGSAVLEAPYRTPNEFSLVAHSDVFFAWLWLVFIGSGIGFVLYIVLLKSWGPVKVSPYAFLTPVVAIFLDYILFQKVINSIEALGTAIIFIALYFAIFSSAKSIKSENQ